MLRQAAFTLLEICLALAIGLVLILLAVPSISGLLAERRLKESFERFDRLVAEARQRSIAGQRPWRLVWTRDRVALLPAASGAAEKDAPGGFAFASGETLALQRTAALVPKPAAEWLFWPNGTCEPAIIAYAGAAGAWQVRYDALTARGIFLQSSIQ